MTSLLVSLKKQKLNQVIGFTTSLPHVGEQIMRIQMDLAGLGQTNQSPARRSKGFDSIINRATLRIRLQGVQIACNEIYICSKNLPAVPRP